MSAFDEHTAVLRDGGGGTHAVVDESWSGYLGAHGGYVAATALRAMTEAVAEPELVPRSLNVQLLEPVAAGALALGATVERVGRSTATATARLVQADRPVALAAASFGADRAGIDHFAFDRPDVPPPQDCRPLGGEPVPGARVAQYVEYRPAADPLPLTGGDRAEIRVWMRLAEDRRADATVATFLADAAVPALYGALSSYVAMPTTDLTLHYATPPAQHSPWVLAVLRTRFAADGYAVEDGELWTPEGVLVLTARQLRRVLAGTPTAAS